MRQEFEILLPRKIPTLGDLSGWTTDQLRTQCLKAFPTHEPLSNIDAAEQTFLALQNFPIEVDNEPVLEFDKEDSAHDAYFYVSRVEHDAPAVFVRMVLWARMLLFHDISEAPSSIEAEKLNCIDRSLSNLFDFCLSNESKSYKGVTDWKSRGTSVLALNRWVRGHQVFAALTQGLVLCFQTLDRSMRSGNIDLTRKSLDLAVCLFEASGAAFELTGDFPPNDYNDHIRPSMMPPFSLEPLSGTMSADHRRLVQIMRDMKPTLNALRVRESSRHDRLSAALAAVYESHKFVCSKFVGEKKSLINSESSEKAGVELIDQFKKVRMKVFEPTSAPRRDSVSQERPLK